MRSPTKTLGNLRTPSRRQRGLGVPWLLAAGVLASVAASSPAQQLWLDSDPVSNARAWIGIDLTSGESPHDGVTPDAACVAACRRVPDKAIETRMLRGRTKAVIELSAEAAGTYRVTATEDGLGWRQAVVYVTRGHRGPGRPVATGAPLEILPAHFPDDLRTGGTLHILVCAAGVPQGGLTIDVHEPVPPGARPEPPRKLRTDPSGGAVVTLSRAGRYHLATSRFGGMGTRWQACSLAVDVRAPVREPVVEDLSDEAALRAAAAALLEELGPETRPRVQQSDHAERCEHGAPAGAQPKSPAKSPKKPKTPKRPGSRDDAPDEILCRWSPTTPELVEAPHPRRRIDTPRGPTTKVHVVTTMPILASIARAVGGDLVSVTSLLPPGSDPHDLRMTPQVTATLKRAELLIESGMGLESWTVRALDASGRTQLRPGRRGHVFATNGISALEKPTAAELSGGGHVHAAGNPHCWLDPLNLKVMARNIEAGLAALRPQQAAALKVRSEAFQREIDVRFFGKDLVKLLGSRYLDRLHRSGRLLTFLERKKLKGTPLVDKLGGWLARARKLKGTSLITYHRTWSYFSRTFGIPVVGTIEEKPGIPASPAHMQRLGEIAKKHGTRLVAAPPFYPRNRTRTVAERIGGLALVLPTQPGEAEAAKDALSLFDTLLTRIEDAVERGS